MYLLKKHIVTLGLLTAIGLAPLAAQAESDSDTGGSPSAAARLNLRVVIPEFLYFRVGSTGGTIDRITFQPGAVPAVMPQLVVAQAYGCSPTVAWSLLPKPMMAAATA
ncbi:MAG: hypothetical protein JRG79_20535 [Deltaproteobacteria bacterium]|nr:hypothetical protein [Deltaproteobacteria bacterium]